MRRLGFIVGIALIISIVFVGAQDDAPLSGILDDDTPFVVIPITVEADKAQMALDVTITEGDLDTVLYLLDSDGNILAANDNRNREDLSSALIYDATADDYQVVIARYNFAQGRSTGAYQLEVDLNQDSAAAIDLDSTALAAAGYPAIDDVEATDWAILAYLGDNAEATLQAFAESDQDTVPIIALANDQLIDVGAAEILAELDSVDVTQFLAWGLENYPSKQVALWSDQSIDSARLGAALARAEVEQIDLLIDNYGGGSSLERYSQLIDTVATAVGTPHLLTGTGFNAGALASILAGDPITASSAAIALAQNYSDAMAQTATATDLIAFADVTIALDSLAERLLDDPTLPQILSEALATSPKALPALKSDEHDLTDLMTQISAASSDSRIAEAATGVRDAIAEAQLSDTGGYALTVSTGLAAFDQRPIVALARWQNVIHTYADTVATYAWRTPRTSLPFHAPSLANPRISRAPMSASILNPALMDVEISGRDIIALDMTLDRIFAEQTQRYSAEPLLDDGVDGVTMSDLRWDVLETRVNDEVNQSSEYLRMVGDWRVLEGRYRAEEDEDWEAISVYFDSTRQVDFVVQHADATTITLNAGDIFQAYDGLVTPDGRVRYQAGHVYIWPESGLSLTEVPAFSSDYALGLQVETADGATRHVATTISIDNLGLPSDLRGDTENFLGFTVPRPAAWTPLTQAEGSTVYRSRNPDGDGAILVYFSLDIFDTDLEAIADALNTNNNLEASSDYTTNSVSDTPVLEYSYRTEDGSGEPLTGQIFVYFNQALQIGVGVAVEGSSERLYQQVRDGTRLFDPIVFEDSLDQLWAIGRIGDEASYPVRGGWQVEREDNGWTRYTPPDDPSGQTFIATQAVPPSAALRLREVALGPERDITEERTYYGDRQTWQVLRYRADRNGVPISGRYYSSEQNERVYLIWMEAPTEAAAPRYAQVFELVVDGFRITSDEAD